MSAYVFLGMVLLFKSRLLVLVHPISNPLVECSAYQVSWISPRVFDFSANKQKCDDEVDLTHLGLHFYLGHDIFPK